MKGANKYHIISVWLNTDIHQKSTVRSAYPHCNKWDIMQNRLPAAVPLLSRALYALCSKTAVPKNANDLHAELIGDVLMVDGKDWFPVTKYCR